MEYYLNWQRILLKSRVEQLRLELIQWLLQFGMTFDKNNPYDIAYYSNKNLPTQLSLNTITQKTRITQIECQFI
ncbi:unnamed protein product [Paramecium sonneborni]|uniref:Uncharacterized protein n=1 Tax=Paramecium sonneborni TaxID=65129 RepID=A0A8S1K627_9CILI|nr:unnamed protein product [Paramecium sonneborni]